MKQLETSKEKAIIEAVLFSMGESVKASKLATALECDEKHVAELIAEMAKDYEASDRGIRIIEVDGAYQLCTKNEMYEYLIKVVKIPKNFKLTDIQLETLSIIAYKQPVTKLEIEKIRGVQSDHAVNRLIDVGLVEEKGRLNTPGRPLVFGTTEEFLRRFGLKNTEELPDIQAEKIEEMKMEAEEEIGYIDDAQKATENVSEGQEDTGVNAAETQANDFATQSESAENNTEL